MTSHGLDTELHCVRGMDLARSPACTVHHGTTTSSTLLVGANSWLQKVASAQRIAECLDDVCQVSETRSGINGCR